MTEIVLLSAILNLLYATTAFALLILALRLLDGLCGFRFLDWINDPETRDLAKAVYLGARIIAGAIVLAGIISLPI